MKKVIAHIEAIRELFTRFPFHDEEISRLSCKNHRAIIEIRDYALIFVGVKVMKYCPTPAYWLEHSFTEEAEWLKLKIITHRGEVEITFADFQFIEKSEFLIIIPNIDYSLQQHFDEIRKTRR